MKHAIGYLRVSTREQGRTGLGLAARVRRALKGDMGSIAGIIVHLAEI